MKYFIVILVFTTFASAQDKGIFKPNSIKKTLEAVEITTQLKIDGVMNEEVWSKVKPSPRFTQINPFQGAVPNHDTEVKVLYDKDNLYFGIFCKDSLGRKAIRVNDFKRDFDFRTHDLVTLCIDGFNDERNAMSIVVNPYGVQRDYLSFDALYYDIDWDGLWKTRTTRTDGGWIAEIAIPWKTLRYPKSEKATQSWGFQLYRNRRLTNEISAFSPFPRSFGAARMDYAGRLTNLKPPPPQSNIRVQPYILTTYNKTRGLETKDESKIKFGGELKWAINSNNVLDLTINTDFAQADVDRQVNNTSRFSVFFPERRQFFLENASLFGIKVAGGSVGGSMRVQPFFSRRIGLNDEGNPISIEAGGRFVHRSSNRNYGAIAIRQKGGNDTDATNFFIGRFSENIGKQNRIGALVTAKNRPDSTNITSTVDAFIRLGKSHSLNTMLSYSTTTNSNKQGFSAIAQYYYSSNTWKAWWTQSLVSKNYNPEMGFISRSDIIGTTPGVIRYVRGEKLPFKKWLRAYEPSVNLEFYHQASTGKQIERQLTAYPIFLNLQNGGYFSYGMTSSYQNLLHEFKPLNIGIKTGEYNYISQKIVASTDPSKKFTINAALNWGSYFNGKLQSQKFQLRYSPIPHISIGGGFNRNKFKNVGTLMTSKTVDLFNLEGRFAINPRVQLTTFYQKNTENNAENINVRFSWEYSPLCFIYLVFNHHGFDDSLQNRQLEDQSIAKISFLKQF
ncbi:MAG: DUF5916 domain-containing protein [Cellulophaga sp.]